MHKATENKICLISIAQPSAHVWLDCQQRYPVPRRMSTKSRMARKRRQMHWDRFRAVAWDLQRCTSTFHGPSTSLITVLKRPASKPRAKSKRGPNPDFAPISASSFFDDALQVAVPSRNLDCRIYYTPPKLTNGTVMICHHGAGYSGLSFACFAKEVGDMTRGECGVLALDARRHGELNP